MANRKSTKGQTTILKTTNKTDRHDITEIFTGHAFVRSRIVKQILCLTHIFCILCLTHIFCILCLTHIFCILCLTAQDLFYNSTSNKCMTCKYFSYIMAVSFIGGFQYRCLSFCTFSFGHCVVCSSIYGFWLHLLYLQTLLVWKRGRPQHLKSVPTFILCQWSLLYKIRMVGHPELKLSHENHWCWWYAIGK
jgi:hypothetical protein